MPRCLTVTPHLPQDDLAARYRHARNPVERSPWHIVWLVASGHHGPAVARLTGYSEDWVRTIVHRYNAGGPAAMADRRQHSAGHPPCCPQRCGRTSRPHWRNRRPTGARGRGRRLRPG